MIQIIQFDTKCAAHFLCDNTTQFNGFFFFFLIAQNNLYFCCKTEVLFLQGKS